MAKRNPCKRKYHPYVIHDDNVTVSALTAKGEEFFIDLVDLHIIENMTFHTDDRNYLYGGTYKNGTKQLHRLIMGEPQEMEIDHKDGNPLNNRRNNLRICTHSENMKNMKIRINSKTGIRGVCWCNRKNKWRSYITSNNTTIHIGYYDDIEEAKTHRLEKQKELHGEYSRVER